MPLSRRLSSHLEATVRRTAEIVLSVAVADGCEATDERVDVTLDGRPVDVQQVADRHGTRLHVVRPEPGDLVVDYAATVNGRNPTVPPGGRPVMDPVERFLYIRPSRYAESDRLFAVSNGMFGDQEGQPLVDAVVDWVHRHTTYLSGSSRHTDGAVDTYLARQGVCRDFAHLVVAFLRARNVPARLVSVYAPGLSPMDFHAVAEAYVDGAWQVLDATRMAPRPSLVRIATGRDAADTAFMTVQGGLVDFRSLQVGATVEGDLPTDDHRTPDRLG